MSGPKPFDKMPVRPHTAGTSTRSTLPEPKPVGQAVVTPGGDQQIKASVFTIYVTHTIEYGSMFPVTPLLTSKTL